RTRSQRPPFSRASPGLRTTAKTPSSSRPPAAARASAAASRWAISTTRGESSSWRRTVPVPNGCATRSRTMAASGSICAEHGARPVCGSSTPILRAERPLQQGHRLGASPRFQLDQRRGEGVHPLLERLDVYGTVHVTLACELAPCFGFG